MLQVPLMQIISEALGLVGAPQDLVLAIKEKLNTGGYNCDVDLCSGDFQELNVEAAAWGFSERQKAIVRRAQKGEPRFPIPLCIVSCLPMLASESGYTGSHVRYMRLLFVISLKPPSCFKDRACMVFLSNLRNTVRCLGF